MLNTGQRLLSLHSFTARALCGAAAGICVAMLSGCQGITASPNRSQVRIIDVSPDAPEIDIYQNSSAIAYRLAFGTITSYVPVDSGAATTMATMSGTRQTLTRSRTTLATHGQYTVLIGNFSANLQQAVLKDQDKPAPAGRIALRFIHQAIEAGMVDIYLVPAGRRINETTPIITRSSFGDNTGYLDLPAGTYTLVVEPAGAVPVDDADAVYAGAQAAYRSGFAGTVILGDQHRTDSGATMQVIVAPDHLSTAESGNQPR